VPLLGEAALGEAALVAGGLDVGALLLPPHAAAASAAVPSGTARIHLRLTARPSVCVLRAGIGYPLASCLPVQGEY
jgi:hypothetical protein